MDEGRSFEGPEPMTAERRHMGGHHVTWHSTLHETSDCSDPAASRRIRIGVFQALFPRIPEPPAHETQLGS